ncbi:MFS transporter small subunit [Cryobacterium glaciale]
MKKAQLVVGWVLVGIPLAFGIIQTLTKVTALFG